MTLTALMPSLRRSIPDPLDSDHWPELTVATITDVIVSGLSLLHLVELSGTPCSLGGCAVIPSTHGRLSANQRTIVTVFRVSSVAPDEFDRGQHDRDLPVRRVSLEATPDRLACLWAEARLIGRASTAHARAAQILLGAGAGVSADAGAGAAADSDAVDLGMSATLPDDLRTGDLIAVPSLPIDISERRAVHPARALEESIR